MFEQISILIRYLNVSPTLAKLSIEDFVLGSGDMTSTIQKEQVAYLGPPSSYSNQVVHVAVVIRLFLLTNPRQPSIHSTRKIMFLYRSLPSKVSQAFCR